VGTCARLSGRMLYPYMGGEGVRKWGLRKFLGLEQKFLPPMQSDMVGSLHVKRPKESSRQCLGVQKIWAPDLGTWSVGKGNLGVLVCGLQP
jgi:hypothetical protein